MNIHVFEGENGQWYFHIKAGNGEIVAQSEGYTVKQSAVDTATLLRIAQFSLTVET